MQRLRNDKEREGKYLFGGVHLAQLEVCSSLHFVPWKSLKRDERGRVQRDEVYCGK